MSAAKDQGREVKQTLNYFSLLGIGEDASKEELEARYQELAEYLASPEIPAALREWASKQAALVDEAYAVLADPEQRAAIRKAQERPAPAPAEVAAAAPSDEPPAAARAAEKAPAKAALAKPTRLPAFLPSLPLQPLLIGAAIGLVALAAVVVFGTDLLGGGGDAEEAPTNGQASDLVPLDTERVAELTAAAAADPKNVEVLFELGESYFLAGEWQSAIDWFTKLVAIEPENVHALTDIGTSDYNLGFIEEAKQTWLKGLEVNPDEPQLHYNLGFLYANSEPPDLESARKEWQTVLELAPDTDLARTVQVHLEGLSEPTPTPTPAP